MNDDIDSPTYHDAPDFKAYVNRIAKLIAKSKRPVCTADIHRKLGYARQHQTLDALESLGLDRVGVLPTRYKIR